MTESRCSFDIMIRSATNADSEEITNMVFQVLREYNLQPDPENTDADLSDIEGSYHLQGGCFDVLVNDQGAIIGSVGLYPLSSDSCELRKMYLSLSERGKGFGKMLLEHALSRAADLGFSNVILETASVLEDAIRLYKGYGFVPYEHPHLSSRTDFAMIKSLTNLP